MFTIGLNKDGELDHLTVRTFDGKEKHIVVNSIASRFGLPTETTPTQDGISSAKWVRDEILIRMLCNEEFCSVEFLSKNAKAQQERDTAKFRAIKAARPVSP